MALNDAAVITPAKGYIYIAPVGTASPTPAQIESFDPTTGISPWVSLGHTARDDLPVFGFEGGDTETKGTWQNATFREVTTTAASDFVTFNCHQFDEQVLELYYSATTPGSTVGKFDVTDAATTQVQKALLIVIVDGTATVGFHATKASFRRDDSMELAVDEFAAFPLRATMLKNSTDPLFSWLSYDTGVNLT
jgi:hypothetical protein